MADWAPGWTPYRYGFDNPILYTDPNGLFESKKEAKRYRRKSTDLSWWNSSIKKNKDGTFDIRDGNSHLAITKNGDGEIEYSAAASPLQIGETRDVKAPDPMGVNYSTGIFGDKATEVYIGDGDWVNLGNYRSRQSAETVAMLFPIGGPVNGGSFLWKVGQYNKIRGLQSGLHAHHVGQQAIMKKFITGYDPKTAPSILVPMLGHTRRGPTGRLSTRTAGFTNARQVLARDIMELRRVYPGIPNSALRELIQLNKQMYPSAFIK